MKVGIVIANHNYERYLASAIDSALAQSHPETQVVVVDDGSTDDSRSIIERYNGKLISVFTENRGQGAAIGTGFEVADADVYIFLDADDVLYPHTAARAAEAFSVNPSLVRFQWPMQTVDANGEPSGPVVPRPDMMASGHLAQHVIRFRTHVWSAGTANAYAAAALRELLPPPEGFRMGVDLYLAETTPLIGEVQSATECLADYRVHGSNNWTRTQGDATYIRQKLQWTIDNHENVVRVGKAHGYVVPADPRIAKDVAFVQQRLASIRMEPTLHPIDGDRRMKLLVQGLDAAVRHPHYGNKHKAKRAAWLLIVAIAPKSLALKAINRFYFRPMG